MIRQNPKHGIGEASGSIAAAIQLRAASRDCTVSGRFHKAVKHAELPINGRSSNREAKGLTTGRPVPIWRLFPFTGEFYSPVVTFLL
jgi:hypothetical protein